MCGRNFPPSSRHSCKEALKPHVSCTQRLLISVEIFFFIIKKEETENRDFNCVKAKAFLATRWLEALTTLELNMVNHTV